ncbi:MAG: helix-turn-helix domain-containing protein [Isosphaeraceae bacterium]
MIQTWVEERTKDPERMKAFQQERLILEVTELIERLMRQQGVSKARLAEKLGKTKGYITQLLDGRTNMTLRTMSDVLFALGRALHVNDGSLTVSSTPVLMPVENARFQVEVPNCGEVTITAPVPSVLSSNNWAA